MRVFTWKGKLINSGKFDGLDSEGAKKAITEFVGGEMRTTYKLRDWVFSRQRYWGEPIPVIHCEKCGVVPVPDKDLPVMLPEVKHYEPTGTGESPLASIAEWVNVECPECGGAGKRETNTMPQWAGSSWYYLRYIDPSNDKALVDKKKEKYWSPVDIYVGGAEHATRHLIYARFWHKFLHDIGAVNYEEPFSRLQHVGLVLAEDGRKMSKRHGNTINPDDIVDTYGADTLRLYEMFMGPFDQSVAWSTKSIIGQRRFLERVVDYVDTFKKMKEENPNALHNDQIQPILHTTIKKVTHDIESFNFNTSISQMMVFLNQVRRFDKNESGKEVGGTYSLMRQQDLESFLKLLAPFAPHIAEELWHELGHKTSVHLESWPAYDESKLKEETVTIAVQVDGKVRDTFEASSDISEKEAKNEAQGREKVRKWTEGKKIKRVIYVKEKLVSIVTEQ